MLSWYRERDIKLNKFCPSKEPRSVSIKDTGKTIDYSGSRNKLLMLGFTVCVYNLAQLLVVLYLMLQTTNYIILDIHCLHLTRTRCGLSHDDLRLPPASSFSAREWDRWFQLRWLSLWLNVIAIKIINHCDIHGQLCNESCHLLKCLIATTDISEKMISAWLQSCKLILRICVNQLGWSVTEEVGWDMEMAGEGKMSYAGFQLNTCLTEDIYTCQNTFICKAIWLATGAGSSLAHNNWLIFPIQ